MPKIGKKELLDLLKRRCTSFVCEQHEKVFTMAESSQLTLSLTGARCKNLLLKDKLQRYYLVVTSSAKSLDLSAVAVTLGSKRLSFASTDCLLPLLGVLPGSLSPLALVNDEFSQIRLVIDAELFEKPAFLFHPLDSTATVALSKEDLEGFLRSIGHPPEWKALAARA